MKTIFIKSSKQIKNIKRFKNLVVAIGIFDGIHRGHQRLIKSAISRARKIRGTSAVLTFFPHPVQVLNKRFDLSLLVSLPHRLRLIEDLGVDVCFVVSFTKKFSYLTAEDFTKEYLFNSLNVKEVFIGKNFHFGRNCGGNSEILKLIARQYKINVHILSSVCYKKNVISSSLLRTLIKKGDLSLSREYLGHPVSAFGRVVHGDGRGRLLGVPTANINSEQEILPPTGVYITEVRWGNKILHGVANIGYRPSFKKEKKRSVEAHIFNFQENIYGENIEIRFLKKIRDERKFVHEDHLRNQIALDKKEAQEYFLKRRNPSK